jgi:hypothetical protein
MTYRSLIPLVICCALLRGFESTGMSLYVCCRLYKTAPIFVDSLLGFLHRVVVDDVANVSEVHAASSFRVEVEVGGGSMFL